MNLNLTVRKALAISTAISLVLVTALAFVAWRGFSTATDSIQGEHKIYQPSFDAMQEARFNVVQVQQYLTDVSATAEEGGYGEAAKAYDEAVKSLDSLATLQPDLAASVKHIDERLKIFNDTGIAMAKAYVSKGRDAGNALMKQPETGFDAAAETLTKDLDKLEETLRERVKNKASETDDRIREAQRNSMLLGLAVAIMAIVSGMALYRILLGLLGAEPARAVEVAQRISEDDFSSDIAIRSGDKSSMMAYLRQMQEALKSRIEKDRAAAAETLRVKIALDNVSTGVMIADNDRNIIYVNGAVQNLLRVAEGDFRKTLPNFSADKVVGQSMDGFYNNPQQQAGMLSRLTGSQVTDLQIGARHLTVTANPVITQSGERVGTVAEWVDRTNEINVQNEVADIVSSASMGDLSQRLAMDGKSGFFASLSDGLNQLLDNTQTSLEATSAVLARVAQGDLTQTINADFGGIFGQLKNDTNATIERLRQVVGQIKEASDAISTASQEIANGNSDLSGRTELQASSLEETASSMEELNATVKQNADNAHQANELTKSSNEIATRGGQMVKQVVSTMNGIQESSKKIADIIGVIDSIAFQTNILALNAAVEAARAGEQGRGFAVVATEVRNLAQRSATAAKEIKELIAESVGKVDSGAKLVDQAGNTMDDVVSSFQQVASLVTEITNASREQSSGIEQVTQAVGQMDEVTQQNAALVEQAAAAAESLEEQARALVQSVAMFKLTEESGRIAGGTLPSRPLRNVTPRRLPPQAKPAPRKEIKKLPPAHLTNDEETWAEF